MLTHATLTLALLATSPSREPIEFDIRMPDGSTATAARILHEEVPTDGMTIVQLASFGNSAKEWARDRASVSLPDGTVRVWAVAGEPEGLDQEFISAVIEIDARSPIDEVFTLSLRRRAGIRSSVTVDVDDAPVPREVFVMSLGPDDAIDLDRLASDGLQFRPHLGSPILDVDPGRYLVGVSFGEGLPIIAHEVVVVTDEVLDVPFHLASSDAGMAFVVDLQINGKRYPGTVALSVETLRRGMHRITKWLIVFQRRVSLRAAKERAAGNVGWRLRRDRQRANGAYVVIPDAAGQRLLRAVAAGEPGAGATLFAKIYGRGGATAFGVPLSPAREDLLISITGLAEVNLTVVMPDPDGPELLAAWCPAATTPHTSDRLDSVRDEFKALVNEGRAKIGPVPAGPADLVLFAIEEGQPGYPVAKLAVDLSVGSQELEIDVPALHDLTIRVDPFFTQIMLSNNEVGFFSAPVVDGTARFLHLPAGDYHLNARPHPPGPPRADTPTSIPALGVLRDEPQPCDAILVIVEDPIGPGTEWGFQDGDLIVGLDGILFQDDPLIPADLRDTIGRPTTFNVEREGREIEIIATLPTPNAARDGVLFWQGSTTMGDAIRVEAEDLR